MGFKVSDSYVRIAPADAHIDATVAWMFSSPEAPRNATSLACDRSCQTIGA